jgi:transcriptional regulator with XRE-family HTH domain
MPDMLAPKVRVSQAPNVSEVLPNLRFMSGDDEKLAFAARLNELCGEAGLPAERGRQTRLAKLFEVTPNAARKWLLGLGLPELEVAIRIAKWADVNVEWLLTGRGAKSGDKVPTRALVVDEVLRSGTPAERRELVKYVEYRLDNSEVPIAAEAKARYKAALESYLPPERKPRH